MKNYKIDPRTKLVIVILLSTLALLYNDLTTLLYLLSISIIISILLSSNLSQLIMKLRRILGVLIAIALFQSIFTRQGTPIFTINDFILLTDYGIRKSLEFILRIGIIICSAAIIGTSNRREIVQAMIKMKIPYEIAFMVSVAIRFLPVFKDEMTDMIISIQLRGIDLKKISIKEKLKVYKYIFVPIVINALLKAKELSAAMEMRGFRAYPVRTSFMVLEMKSIDYIIITFGITIAIVLILIF